MWEIRFSVCLCAQIGKFPLKRVTGTTARAPSLAVTRARTPCLPSEGRSSPTEECDCGFDHCPIRRDLAMTVSQAAHPDPSGLPRGRYMMGPTVTTHGLSVSQICPFVSEEQSIRLSLFGGSHLAVWMVFGYEWNLPFQLGCRHQNEPKRLYFCVDSIKDTCWACCTVSLTASHVARSLLSTVSSSCLLFNSLI